MNTLYINSHWLHPAGTTEIPPPEIREPDYKGPIEIKKLWRCSRCELTGTMGFMEKAVCFPKEEAQDTKSQAPHNDDMAESD